MRKLVMGDIHGAYKAVKQCLKRSAFDYENDQLIQLGDVVDRYPQSYECVEELLKVKHLIALKGNHDDWFDEFAQTEFHPYSWNYGGKATLSSYLKHVKKSGRFFLKGAGYKSALEPKDIPESHKTFFSNQVPYYIDEEQRCFVHAGFNASLPFLAQDPENYYWDRSLWEEALHCQEYQEQFSIEADFKEIYIGHTPTTKTHSDQPLSAFNIYNLDTGAGNSGRLTIMDIDTKEFWQSDLTSDLYEGYTV
ncbi:MAG: metallophosphoesterase [Pedobacter sp.]